jgi:FkbM family methyltransferase
VFDIGARYGWYPLLVTQANPSVRVFAFEANAETFAHLLANAALRSIRCFNLELAKPKRVDRPHPGTRVNATRTVDEPVELKASRSMTIDSFVEQQQIRDIDLIRCNVEDDDFGLVTGARKLTTGSPAPIWLIRVSAELPTSISLASKDFYTRLVSLLSGGRADGELLSQDQDGRLVEMRSVGKQMRRNIFYVPNERRSQFEAAAATMDRP